MDSLIFIIALIFLICGICFGMGARTVKNGNDACLNCHGTAGGAPDLGTVSGVEDLASLTAALWNHLVAADRDPGGPSFEAWPVINGREMADILAFFQASTP